MTPQSVCRGSEGERRCEVAQYYISEPDKWKKVHIPFTAYFLAQDPDTKFWHIVEKEFTVSDVFAPPEDLLGRLANLPPYRYRFL